MATSPNVDPKSIHEEDELVSIFDTSDEAEAMVVQGLLESNGIESLLSNLDAPQDVLPGVGGVVIRVRPSEADEAREIIEQQRNAELDSEQSNQTEIL
jgi:Putative prokaryotic signal transducing protein